MVGLESLNLLEHGPRPACPAGESGRKLAQNPERLDPGRLVRPVKEVPSCPEPPTSITSRASRPGSAERRRGKRARAS
jgi:hypothetical protein